MKLETAVQKSVAVFAAVLFFCSAAFAGEVDKLASILAEKGIISYGEAQQIITETNEEIRQKTASGTNSSIPAWIQNIKFSGDIRLRYQSDWAPDVTTRSRERLRLRFGFEARPAENMTAAFGLATSATSSGSDENPTSTNYTFQGFNKAPIFIDYAYLQYDIQNIGKLSAGKIKGSMATWNIKQLIWDGDINPDGVTLNLNNRKLGNGFELFGNIGWLIINGDVQESNSGRPNDMPDVYILQPGVNYKNGSFSARAALGYQQFNTKGRAPYGSNATGNYLGDAARYTNLTDFRLINPAAEIKMSEAVGKYTVKVFGEYVKNLDDSVYKNDNEGGLYGITFGDDRISKFGDWNVTYAGRYLMSFAIPYGLGFSDAYNGRPNVRGYEIGLNFGLTKNTAFAFNYLNYDLINGNKAQQSLAQCDISYKF
ncbi:MAG: putative porin [Endomicrobia bacterium]|nr:putative porin [Endomicrobiia bacterium]